MTQNKKEEDKNIFIGFNIDDINNFAKNYNISVYVYDLRGDLIEHHKNDSNLNKNYKSLVFMMKDNHIYPIVDE